MLDKMITVLFSGDDYQERRAKNDTNLDVILQTLVSARSIRDHWSKDVKIKFVHTHPLKEITLKYFDMFDIEPTLWKDGIPTDELHQFGNKILVTKLEIDTPYFMILDGDTVIHSPLEFDNYDKHDLSLSYASGFVVSRNGWKHLFKVFGATMPVGDPSRNPARDYWIHDKPNLFPWFNTGVVFGKTDCLRRLGDQWIDNMRSLRGLNKKGKELDMDHKISGQMRARAEPISFVLAIHQLGLSYGVLPKGYNMNTKNSGLKKWEGEVIISHYLGLNCEIPQYVQKHLVEHPRLKKGAFSYKKLEED